ncbi:FKBP-type peptidyl-prolyl cis-trans isomerase [Cryptosporidium felis]|nr:FKBP-type peptidyl-prolyl cis-trans isomerase [Cryptosporidium felis]
MFKNATMKLFLRIAVLASLLNLSVNCSKLEWTGKEFDVRPLSEFSSNPLTANRTLLCESCQLITFALKKYISKELSVYKNSSPPKGFIDIVVSNFLESHVACSNHVWQPLADNSLIFTIEEFISTCRDNLGNWEPKLESLSTSKMSFDKEISLVCLTTKSCENEAELWSEIEYPENRESKASLLKKRSEDFFAKNKERNGVITTESGLQYIVLKEGTGQVKPRLEDNVEVHYRGRTLGGVDFDASFNRGNEPAKMKVSQLIPAWVEALTLMTEGQELLIFAKPELAYGKEGAGDMIGPNETIIFKLRLVKIVSEAESSSENSPRVGSDEL